MLCARLTDLLDKEQPVDQAGFRPDFSNLSESLQVDLKQNICPESLGHHVSKNNVEPVSTAAATII